MSLATLPLAGLQASIHARSPSSVSSASSTSTTRSLASDSAPTAFSTFSTFSTLTPPSTPPDSPVPSPTPSPSSSPSTSPSTAKPKAFYRLVRLNQNEIARRNVAGHCTYCNDTGHARRACAAGRIMRKVPKRVLDARLRSSVCPLCGDPRADGHSKRTCPEKQRLQAVLDAKRHSPPSSAAGKGKDGTSADQIVQNDLIDLMDLDTGRASAASSCLHVSRLRASCAPAWERYSYRLARHRPNLLDTVVTEVVWGGVSLPVAKIGTISGVDMDMDMDVDMDIPVAALAEDLIEM